MTEIADEELPKVKLEPADFIPDDVKKEEKKTAQKVKVEKKEKAISYKEAKEKHVAKAINNVITIVLNKTILKDSKEKIQAEELNKQYYNLGGAITYSMHASGLKISDLFIKYKNHPALIFLMAGINTGDLVARKKYNFSIFSFMADIEGTIKEAEIKKRGRPKKK